MVNYDPPFQSSGSAPAVVMLNTVCAILRVMCVHLTLIKSLFNLRTERALETNLTSIVFSRRVAKDSRSSWLQTLI